MNSEEILKLEYKELCKDWRMRDKYVLDKLNASGIGLALVGLSIASIPAHEYLFRLSLAFMGAFFSWVMSVSVFKDILYRDYTEKLLERLFAHFEMGKSLLNLRNQKGIKDDLDLKKIKFPRKIEIEKGKEPQITLEIPGSFIGLFHRRRTFTWVFYFYFAWFLVFSVFVPLFIISDLIGLSELTVIELTILIILFIVLVLYCLTHGRPNWPRGRVINPHHLKALRKLYARLKESTVPWAVVGSLGLALQGLPVKTRDIDIRSDKDGVYEIERLFKRFSTKEVTFSSSEKVRSYFGTLEIDGITVEIMGDLQFQNKNGTWREPEDFTKYIQTVRIENMDVPVLSLEYEYKAYLLLGRTDKAKMIKEWLDRKE